MFLDRASTRWIELRSSRARADRATIRGGNTPRRKPRHRATAARSSRRIPMSATVGGCTRSTSIGRGDRDDLPQRLYPAGLLAACPPRDRRDYDRRVIGTAAPSRWQCDWCAESPGPHARGDRTGRGRWTKHAVWTLTTARWRRSGSGRWARVLGLCGAGDEIQPMLPAQRVDRRESPFAG